MAGLSQTSASTAHPVHKGAGFPPFETATYPSQLFWLAITFGFLFVVLWRVGGPMIAGTIGARRARIDGDLKSAEDARRDANSALSAYQTALSSARSKAHASAEEMRKKVTGEIDRAKAQFDSEAAAALEKAQTRIAAVREAARTHVAAMAEAATTQIVQRLTGEIVGGEAVKEAVKTARQNGGSQVSARATS
jgi:F-type H+-transporting ATPase subunit b